MHQPNILLIVLDDVRKDHLSYYGHRNETTPNLDHLATDSIVFENAFANSNWTPVSHGAIFTGRLPSHTGIYGNTLEIPEVYETLPELLNKQGYQTFSTSAGAHLRAERGYARGFDEYQVTHDLPSLPDISASMFSLLIRDSAYRKQFIQHLLRGWDKATVYKFESLKKWIRSVDNGPYFGFINLKTAHSPYRPPRPYKDIFTEKNSQSQYVFLDFVRNRLTDTDPTNESDTVRIERVNEASEQFPILADEFDLNPQEWKMLEDWYDGAIRYLDEKIGDLVDFLTQRGDLKDTYLIITSDHGELFGEHGLQDHLFSLYEEILRVPLVIHTPDTVTKTIDHPVTLADLYPTIADIAGQKAPRDPHSTSLYPFENRHFHEYTFAEVGQKSERPIKRNYPSYTHSNQAVPLQVVRDNEHKLIYSESGLTELYNWREDPTEQTDLSDDRPEIVERLTGIIEEQLHSLSKSPYDESTENEKLKKTLEDLGYL